MSSEEHDEHLKRTDRVLTNAYVFDNGNVMAFDQFGQQMPEYQTGNAIADISRDYPNIVVARAVWR